MAVTTQDDYPVMLRLWLQRLSVAAMVVLPVQTFES